MSRWKQGDTLPNMVIDCFDDSRSRPDLSDAQEITLLVHKNGALAWQRDVTASGNASGTVDVELQPADVATPGTYHVKVRVVWADGRRQHYPAADQWLTMTVTR